MPGLLSSKELRQKRAELHDQNTKLLEKAKTENRDRLSAEENTEWEKRDADIVDLTKQIEKVEAHEERAAEMAASRGTRAGRQDSGREEKGDAEERAERENRAFENWLRNGEAGLSADDRKVMAEKRAQSVGTNTAGGYTVAPEFYGTLTEAQKAFGGMRTPGAATVIRTATGATLPMPTENDTAQAGELVGEGVAVTNGDDTFGIVNIGAYKYSSKAVLVSLELLQDSAFDINSLIARKLGIRIARGQNAHFTVGTGTSQPKGIVTASTLGKTGVAGQTTSVIYDDLVDLQHSVDPAYRVNAKWMMADSSLKVIKKLKDSQGHPLWAPGIAVKEPDTILGQGYVINQDMPAMAANAKSILYGDIPSYFVRDVMEVVVLRLVERYAELGQVGFIAFARADGNLLDAGTNPVKYYANSAT